MRKSWWRRRLKPCSHFSGRQYPDITELQLLSVCTRLSLGYCPSYLICIVVCSSIIPTRPHRFPTTVQSLQVTRKPAVQRKDPRESGCVLFILFKHTLGLYVVQFSVTKYYIHTIQGHHNKESTHDFWPSWCTSHFSSPVENIMGFDYCRRDPQVPCAGQTFWLNSQRVPPEGVAKVRVGWVSVEFMLSKEMQEIWNWL